jgi:tRNA(Ile)-lysidine synthase
VKLEIGSSLQAKARDARYAALAEWARESRAKVLLTAHHIDDQAETVLMRLARGAGLGGLAGVRATRPLGPDLNLARPLLGWRKDELRRIVEQAGLEAADDPSNADPRHDRTAMRALLANQSRLDPERLAASAQHLLQAEDALAWTAQRLASERLAEQGLSLTIDAGGLPDELARRLLLIAFDRLKAPPPRGPDLVRAVVTLRAGGSCTLSEVQLGGGELWTLGPAPPRRSRKK